MVELGLLLRAATDETRTKPDPDFKAALNDDLNGYGCDLRMQELKKIALSVSHPPFRLPTPTLSPSPDVPCINFSGSEISLSRQPSKNSTGPP